MCYNVSSRVVMICVLLSIGLFQEGLAYDTSNGFGGGEFMNNSTKLSTVINLLYSDNNTFRIVDQPPIDVKQGSIQTISWDSDLVLTEVRVDLYKNSRFMAKLSETNKNVRTFAWHVGDSATLGSGYFIKISVKAVNGKSAWANTNNFNIKSMISWNKNYLWFLMLLLLFVFICLCCKKKKYKNNSYPYALPVTSPATNPVDSGSGDAYMAYNQGRNTGRAEGVVTGVILDEVLQSNRRHNHNRWWNNWGGGGGSSWGGNWGGGGDSNNGFGGGDFGTSLFGGSGGDNSNGFS